MVSLANPWGCASYTHPCLCPQITDLGPGSWASIALICSEVHVVLPGSRPVCSRSCKYCLPVLPCLVALPAALPTRNSLLLYSKFSHCCCRARCLPCTVVFWLSSQVRLRSAPVGAGRYRSACFPAAGHPSGPCWAFLPRHTPDTQSQVSAGPCSLTRPLSFGTCSGICLEDKSPSWLFTESSKTLTNCAGPYPTPAHHTWHCTGTSVQEATQASPMADSILLSTCTEARNKQDSSMRTEVKDGTPGLGNKRGHKGTSGYWHSFLT